MSESQKIEDLNNLSVMQLKEILHRENLVLSNSKLIEKLPDKGKSTKNFRDRVEMEIRFRENLEYIEASIKKLTLNDTEKHVQKLCDTEGIPKEEKYKPFASLNNTNKAVQPDSKIFQDCVHYNKPKLIALPESIIPKKQDEKIREEQVKPRVLEKLQNHEENKNSAETKGTKSGEEAKGHG